MKDIYYSRVPWFPALLQGGRFDALYAVTFRQTTWWTVGTDMISDAWRRHEDCHKAQYARDGWFLFTRRYIWQWLAGIFKYRSITQAYLNVSYEVEARQAAARG